MLRLHWTGTVSGHDSNRADDNSPSRAEDNSPYQGTTSVVPTIRAGIKGFSPCSLLSCEMREAITELVTCRGELSCIEGEAISRVPIRAELASELKYRPNQAI